MKRLWSSALLFVAIGVALYAGLYYASERLVYRTGKSNPFFKIATAEHLAYDWVVLGASHAMPLDFADFNAFMQRETNLRIINLASPGTGPLYNRFVLESFLSKRRAGAVLYVVDSFAFYSRTWNEDRFADVKLIRRTPFDRAIATRLWRYCIDEGVDPRTLLDYVIGFSKVNNRERFEPDIWEGEKQFDRVYRTSATAIRSRIDYLYPEPPAPAAFARYLQDFDKLVAMAQRHGIKVAAVKMPVPAQFRSRIPNEAAFDQAFVRIATSRKIPFYDFSRALYEPRFYFDTDHLNRAGLTEFFNLRLRSIFVGTIQ